MPVIAFCKSPRAARQLALNRSVVAVALDALPNAKDAVALARKRGYDESEAIVVLADGQISIH